MDGGTWVPMVLLIGVSIVHIDRLSDLDCSSLM